MSGNQLQFVNILQGNMVVFQREPSTGCVSAEGRVLAMSPESDFTYIIVATDDTVLFHFLLLAGISSP